MSSLGPIAIIPARGGSKRIPRKNIRPFMGVPMLERAIKTAKACGIFETIEVSTEDDEIANMALACGADVVDRPDTLAEIGAPDCGTQEVTRHAIWASQQPTERPVCCLYPCTPLLKPEDIVRGYAMLKTIGGAYVYPVIGTDKATGGGLYYFGYAWAFLGRLRLDDQFTSRIPIDPTHWVDIDTERDWIRAENLYQLRELEI